MNNQERLELALDKLVSGQSPRHEAAELSSEEQSMLQMAQLLRGPQPEAPRPEFVERMRQRGKPRRVTRRFAFQTGLGGLAAGLAAGLGIERLVQGPAPQTAVAPPWAPPLVGNNGEWYRVATVAEVPPGAIVPFTAGAVQGFLMNRRGTYRALSRMCTDMGCKLDFLRPSQSFVCPCHGAKFDLKGDLHPKSYPAPLPSLPELRVRLKDEHIEVWSV